VQPRYCGLWRQLRLRGSYAVWKTSVITISPDFCFPNWFPWILINRKLNCFSVIRINKLVLAAEGEKVEVSLVVGRSTSQTGTMVHRLYGIANGRREAFRDTAKTKLKRWGFNCDRRCCIPRVCRNLLVRIPGRDEVFPCWSVPRDWTVTQRYAYYGLIFPQNVVHKVHVAPCFIDGSVYTGKDWLETVTLI